MTINRRTVLQWALKMSYFGMASLLPAPVAAMVKPGMRSVRGDVRVNGTSADPGLIVRPGDRLTTGLTGEAIVVIDANAYLLRPEGEIVFPEQNAAEKVLSVVSGKLLAVFGPGDLILDLPLATIGIRGTGLYVEATPEKDYVCLCYGKAVLRSKLNVVITEQLDTFHHDMPRNFHANPADHSGLFIEPAKMVNHIDEELIMLEALTQRIPLFGPDPIKMPDQN